jgi:hypothetical protein
VAPVFKRFPGHIYLRKADPATKAFLIENVDDLWLKADEAMEAWRKIVEAGKDPDMEISNYKAIKSKNPVHHFPETLSDIMHFIFNSLCSAHVDSTK